MISDKYRCVFVHIPKTGGTSIEQALGHFDELERNAQDHRPLYELREAMSEPDFGAWFKFAFVRNPWARIASWYKNVITDELHQQNFGVSPDCTLEQFLTDHRGIFGMQKQLHWLRDRDGSIPLDFIGRFERLLDDWAVVCDRLGQGPIELPHLIVAKDKRPYTALYDDTTRKLVAERYAEEIEMFGYRFGD